MREVTRPDRAERRRRGKSDPIDAYQAARAVLAGRAEALVKDEDIEALRALRNARASAVNAATAAMNQIHSLLVTAPVVVRERYRALTDARLVNALADSRPDTRTGPGTARVVLGALRTLARRHQFLTGQADQLQEQLRILVAELNPTLLAAPGRRPQQRRTAADHRRGQPRPAAQRGLLRRIVRCRTRAGVLGPHQPPPALARW